MSSKNVLLYLILSMLPSRYTNTPWTYDKDIKTISEEELQMRRLAFEGQKTVSKYMYY